MYPQFDIVSGLLGIMWACLAAAAVGYALRPIIAGRNAVVLVTAVAALAFAAGYLAHRNPVPRGVTVPAHATFGAEVLNRLSVETTPALGGIDGITNRPGLLEVAGWAADGLRYAPGAGIFLIVDGSARSTGMPAIYGIDRPDVARAFDDADLLWVGFGIRYVPTNLSPGRHFAQVALVSRDLKHAYVIAKRVEFMAP